MDNYNSQINKILRLISCHLNEEINESKEDEDLSGFNRIAGFYHLDTKEFELFPRTTEEISPEEDRINDYIHMMYEKGESSEFKIVRFGIEDLVGAGRVCYIEADKKRDAEACYYAILDKYANDLEIDRYELEYLVGDKVVYVAYNMYGDEINESQNKELKEGTYYTDEDDYINKYGIFWILDQCELNNNLWYPLINPEQYKKALTDFTRDGKLLYFSSKKIQDWVDIICKNSAIFHNINILYGNEDYVPVEEVYDYYYGNTEKPLADYRNELFNSGKIKNDDDLSVMEYILGENDVYEKINLPDGNIGYSDTQGFEFVFDKFDKCDTDEEYLVAINEILDVWHKRSDLSSMFINGGRKELSKITNESIEYAQSNDNDLNNIILKNPSRKELSDNNMEYSRGVLSSKGNMYFINLNEIVHGDLFNYLENIGIDEAPYYCFRYNNKNNTFYIYSPDRYDEETVNKIKTYKNINNFSGCSFEMFDYPDYDIALDESIVSAETKDDDLAYVILRNPSAKELSEYKNDYWRVCVLKNGDFYYAKQDELVHDEIISELVGQLHINYSDEAYRLMQIDDKLIQIVYKEYEENDDVRVKIDEKEIEKQFEKDKEIIKNSPYIKSNFPNIAIGIELRDEEANWIE